MPLPNSYQLPADVCIPSHSQLQDAECAKCHTNLGQKCLKTPINHVFTE